MNHPIERDAKVRVAILGDVNGCLESLSTTPESLIVLNSNSVLPLFHASEEFSAGLFDASGPQKRKWTAGLPSLERILEQLERADVIIWLLAGELLQMVQSLVEVPSEGDVPALEEGASGTLVDGAHFERFRVASVRFKSTLVALGKFGRTVVIIDRLGQGRAGRAISQAPPCEGRPLDQCGLFLADALGFRTVIAPVGGGAGGASQEPSHSLKQLVEEIIPAVDAVHDATPRDPVSKLPASQGSGCVPWPSVECFISQEDFCDGTHLVHVGAGMTLPVHIQRGKAGHSGPVPVLLGRASSGSGTIYEAMRGEMGLPESVPYIFIGDPAALLVPSPRACWMTSSQWVDTEWAVDRVVEALLREFGAPALFLGGGDAGYAALQLHLRFPGSQAVVWNPQTDVFDYGVFTSWAAALFPSLVLSDSAVNDHGRWRQLLGARTSTTLRESADLLGSVLYLQNADDWHMTRHFLPLIERSDVKKVVDHLHFGQGGAAFLAYPWGRQGSPPMETVKRAVQLMLSDGMDAQDSARRLMQEEGHPHAALGSELSSSALGDRISPSGGGGKSAVAATGERSMAFLESAARRTISGLDRNSTEFRRIIELIPQEVEEYARLRGLLFRESDRLPWIGGWAVTTSTISALVSEVLGRTGAPLVLELGSGVSTLWLAAAIRHRGEGRLVTLEHQDEFFQATGRWIRSLGLEQWCEVVHAPLSEFRIGEDSESLWYDVSCVPDSTFDLVFVDGPPASTGPMARYPALQVLQDRLASSATIVLDDVVRRDEEETVQRWIAEAQGQLAVFERLPKAVSLAWSSEMVMDERES